MKIINIVFVCQSASYHRDRLFGQGGADSQIFGIALELSNMGHEVGIIGNFIGGNWKDSSVNNSNITFIKAKTPILPDLVIGNLISGLLLSKKIERILRRRKPDLIILAGSTTGYFPSKIGIPFFYITHNPNGMDFYKEFLLSNHWLNRFSFPIQQKLEEKILQKSNAIFALNTRVKLYLLSKGFTNVYSVPNGVNTVDYFVNNDGNNILFAGGLRKVKGIDLLIRAFSSISKKYNENLIIIGSGKEEDNLKNIARSLNIQDRIQFISLVNKVTLRKYLAECSIFVLPSLFEMMPVTLLEAMASGKIVIASDIPGPCDIISHGIDGYLFKKRDLSELVQCLEYCLANKEEMKIIGSMAKMTVEHKYTFNIIAKQYMAIYYDHFGE
jgi:glycosyltransferase involved in cell wall biosynthesis